MDLAKFLAYTTQLSAELSLLAAAGHRQFVTGQAVDGTCAFIVATGPEEAAMLARLMERMEGDPEFVAWRARRSPKAQSDLIAAVAPDRD